MSEEKQLTVSELIELLKNMPKDYPVYTEGCDCYGCALGVKVDELFSENENIVLITRIDE